MPQSEPDRAEPPAPAPSSGASATLPRAASQRGAQAKARRTIGPVFDLERHLPPDWWRSLFNSLYLKTDGDVVENDQNTLEEVDLLLEASGLAPDDRVLDLCCGQGRHALELARRGFSRVWGVDRSRYLIRLARKRASKAGLHVRFQEGDARRLALEAGAFDCVAIFGNSFGYFDQPEDDLAVLRSIARVLRPGGTLAMDIVDGRWQRANFEKRSWEWIDKSRLVCRERSLSADETRLISREVIVHDQKGVIADQFYAERLFSPESIAELLKDAGFARVRFHGSLEAKSTREQDLGMMARRLFITAQAPASAAPAIAGRFAPKVITVLLGDPRLPDPVKREGKFNAEDLETVQRLKDALASLTGRRFVYVDDHGSLMRALLESPPEFAFNLCDEGLHNDARLELHVPALLESLGVPYTGAGPACLGLCFNKSLVRAIAQDMGVPTPLETYIDAEDQSARLPSVFPSLVKPNFGDSSVGITDESVVRTPAELVARVASLRAGAPHEPILVQEFLSGVECTVGVVGNPGMELRALPVLEVDYSGLPEEAEPILSYDSKWTPGSPHWERVRYVRSRTPASVEREMIDASFALFERLGCRDYARFDFRADASGQMKLLEVNPNPGWCWDGKLNLMAELEGMTYAQLLEAILEAALARVAAERVPR